MKRSTGKNLTSVFFCSALCIALSGSNGFSDDAPTPCGRDWARKASKNESFKMIGLGLSTKSDLKEAAEEARNGAVKDILFQLQSAVQAKSEIKSTTSSSTASSEILMTAKIDDLKGLKPIKSGANPTEKITDCEVYEFNVQSAYREASSQAEVFLEKIEGAARRAESGAGLSAIKDLPDMKKSVAQKDAEFRRADIYKTVLGVPGPGLVERAERALAKLEEAERQARGRIVFVLDSGKFEAAVADLETSLANSGVKTATSPKVEKGDGESAALPVLVDIREIGAAKKSKTRLGLTVTRKIQIRLIDARTKAVLAANRGLSAVGTSADGDEDQARENSESQITAGVYETIRSFMPALLKKD